MSDKKTLSARVPTDTAERIEEFRMRRGINRTDAMRRLLDEGLDVYGVGIEEEEEETDTTEKSDPDIGPLTQSERWFRKKFEGGLAGMLLTAPATLALIVVFGGMDFFLSVNLTTWLPAEVLSVLIMLGILAFVVFGVVAGVTGAFLKLGWARQLDERAGADDQGAAA